MPNRPIAYFCAEYGIDHRLPIYAGGLGVLAGDTLKAAADFDLPFIGIGLLYGGKKARQRIDESGWQHDEDVEFDPAALGLEYVYHEGEPVFISIPLDDRAIWARVWRKKLSSNTQLYLLDTNTQQNSPEDRRITDSLYFGNETKQLQQLFVLGVGGVKLLEKLKIEPQVYHLNEGRAALMIWQRLYALMKHEGLDFSQALAQVQSSLVYTNHTLVPAGNYTVSRELMWPYLEHFAQLLEVSPDQLWQLSAANDRFSLTDMAMNYSRRQSGVSQLHTKMSRQLWPNHDWHNITNGVHLPTWQDQRFKQPKLDDQQLWQLHSENKQRLASFVRERTGFQFDPQSLILGWARRLAGYKRLDALFQDLERLREIIEQSPLKVQILIAGKVHQQDEGGKRMLQQVIKQMAGPMSGKALFIPDYNLEVAEYLVKGSDVWVNLPIRGKEACGTSGMKALSNGVLQCTTLDGWTDEVKWQGLGWTVESDQVSEHFYQTLASEIIPMFEPVYQGQIEGTQWLKRMRESILLAEHFSAKRMLSEYQEKLYASVRSE